MFPFHFFQESNFPFHLCSLYFYNHIQIFRAKSNEGEIISLDNIFPIQSYIFTVLWGLFGLACFQCCALKLSAQPFNGIEKFFIQRRTGKCRALFEEEVYMKLEAKIETRRDRGWRSNASHGARCSVLMFVFCRKWRVRWHQNSLSTACRPSTQVLLRRGSPGGPRGHQRLEGGGSP